MVLARPEKAIVLDLTDTLLMDAYGLGNLLILNGLLSEKSVKLVVLIASQSGVLSKVQAAGLDKIITVCASVAQCASVLAAL